MYDHVYFTNKLSKLKSLSIHCSRNTANPNAGADSPSPENSPGFASKTMAICESLSTRGPERLWRAKVGGGGGQHEGSFNPGAHKGILF